MVPGPTRTSASGGSRWPTIYGALVVATDLLLINGSFLATSLFKFNAIYPVDEFAPIYLRFHLFLNALVPLCLALSGAYREIGRAPLGTQTTAAFKACLWAAAIAVGALFLVRNEGYSRVFVTFQLVQVAVLIPFSRMLLVRVNESAHLKGLGVRRVLVAGERGPLRDLALFLRMAPHMGYRVEAVLPIGFEAETESPLEPEVIADRGALRRLLESGRIDRIFICDRSADGARWKGLIELAMELSVEARLVRWPLLVPGFRTRIHDLLTVPVMPVEIVIACRGVGKRVKRALDVTVSALGLALTAPFLAAMAVAIKLDSHGPILYRQARVTAAGRRFEILKFRSMHTLADEERARLGAENEAIGPIFKMRSDPRVTRVGSFLRRFSLDELPQLLNVLRGDLSLVGPRPPLPEETEDYEPWQRHRLDVVQGITGLWQVSGRSRLSFEEMALLDLYYIEHWSILLDLEILMETVPTVLHGDGAY